MNHMKKLFLTSFLIFISGINVFAAPPLPKSIDVFNNLLTNQKQLYPKMTYDIAYYGNSQQWRVGLYAVTMNYFLFFDDFHYDIILDSVDPDKHGNGVGHVTGVLQNATANNRFLYPTAWQVHGDKSYQLRLVKTVDPTADTDHSFHYIFSVDGSMPGKPNWQGVIVTIR